MLFAGIDLHGSTAIYEEVIQAGSAYSFRSPQSGKTTQSEEDDSPAAVDSEIKGETALDLGVSEKGFTATGTRAGLAFGENEKNDIPSSGYAQFILRREASSMAQALSDLKDNLNVPEGARYMSYFRHSLQNMWEVKAALPMETVLLISAIEEAVHEKKWRELSLSQLNTLGTIVSRLPGGEPSRKALRDSLSTMQRSWLDIFPSSEHDYESIEDEEG